jgi:TP901 family phage tail tape measure protein
MAGNYKNSILLGVKLRPTAEVQAELNTLISQLNGNSNIRLGIDTNQANQSLKEFSNTLTTITNQLKNGINLNGNTDNIDKQEQAVRRLSSTITNMQNKLNTASSNGFINESVLTNLQNKLNGINTNTAESEIKELQRTINNLGSTDSQIVRLQNAITKMETGLTNMKGKYSTLVGDSSSRTQLDAYTSQVEKLKTILNSLQNGGTISGAKLASELNLGTNANRDLTNAVRNSSSAFKLAQNDANSFGSSIKNALSNAGLYVGTYQAIQMMANTFKDAVSTVIQMDTALGNLNKVVSMSSAQLLQMRDNAVEMGKELGRSSIEVANAQAEFGRLYKTQNEINSMTKVSVMGANVMDNVTSADVAKGLTTVITSMKLESKDSMDILDSMNEIQNNYRIGAKDLLNALAEVGSTAYTSGTNLKQVEGYITSIAVATGKSGDEIGNSLKSIMSRVYKLGAEGLESEGKPEKMLNDMGVAVRDASGNFRNFSTILGDLDVKWQKMSNTEKIATAQVVGGVHRYNDFMSLMNNYSMAVDSTNTALGSQGSALKENEIHMQTAEAKLGTLKATTEAFYMRLINSDAIKSAIDGLTKLVETFGNLPTIIGLTTSALVAFSGKAIMSAIASVGGYITSLISLASTEGIVATATGELTLAMATNPFGLIAIAIASVTVGLVALNHAYEESTNYIGKMNEATKGLQELKSTENLVKQYRDLNNIIYNTSSTTEQITNAKEKLLSVQKQLASQNPDLVDGYTKEGDALVRNINLLEEKINKDKRNLIAQAESNYGSLINQVNDKQMNKFYDTASDSVWWLPGSWKSDIETYNNLIKESENSENGLSNGRKEKLAELSTKFGDLNKAIITMKDNGQDVSGKQIFDFSTGELVNATQYLKDIELQSIQTSNKTQLVSQAMKELNSSTGLSSNMLEKLNSVYPDMEINVDNAKQKIQALNTELNNGSTNNAEQQAKDIEKATESYSKATEEIAKMQSYIDKLNKAQAMTPTLAKQISNSYPEIGNGINSVATAQDFLNKKIQEQVNEQNSANEIMKSNDEDFYQSKIANNQEYQSAYNDFLNAFVTDGKKADDIDFSNYKTLNELKQSTQHQLGVAIENWLTQFVGSSAQGYADDFENFRTTAEQKASVLAKLNEEIKKINANLAGTDALKQSISDRNNFYAVTGDDMSDPLKGLNEDVSKRIDTNTSAWQTKLANLNGAVKEVDTNFDKFGASMKGFSGGDIGGTSDFSGTGKDKSGAADAKKAQQEAIKAEKEALDELTEAYDKAKSIIEDDINAIDTKLEELGDTNSDNFVQKVDLTNQKLAKQQEEVKLASEQLQKLKDTSFDTAEGQDALEKKILSANKELRTQTLEASKLHKELEKLEQEQLKKYYENQKEIETQKLDATQQAQNDKLDEIKQKQEDIHNARMDALDAELKVLEEQNEAEDKSNELQEKQNDLKQKQIDLERIRNQGDVQTYSKDSSGNWGFGYTYNKDTYNTKQKEVDESKKSLEETKRKQKYEEEKKAIEEQKTAEEKLYKEKEDYLEKYSKQLKDQQERDKKRIETYYSDIDTLTKTTLKTLEEQYNNNWTAIANSISTSVDKSKKEIESLQTLSANFVASDIVKALVSGDVSGFLKDNQNKMNQQATVDENEIDNYFKNIDASANNANDTILKLSDSYKSLSTIKEENLNITDDDIKQNKKQVSNITKIDYDGLAEQLKNLKEINAQIEKELDTHYNNELARQNQSQTDEITSFDKFSKEYLLKTNKLCELLQVVWDFRFSNIVEIVDNAGVIISQALQAWSIAYEDFAEIWNKMNDEEHQIANKIEIKDALSTINNTHTTVVQWDTDKSKLYNQDTFDQFTKNIQGNIQDSLLNKLNNYSGTFGTSSTTSSSSTVNKNNTTTSNITNLYMNQVDVNTKDAQNLLSQLVSLVSNKTKLS